MVRRMIADFVDPSIVRFSASELPEKDRIAIWQDCYSRVAMKLDVQLPESTSFDYAFVGRKLPGLQLLSATLSPLRVSRTRELIADGNDDLALIINVSGLVSISARGEQVALSRGDAVLMSSTEPMISQRHLRGSSLSLVIPRSLLESIVVDVASRIMNRIPRDTGELKLLCAYASTIIHERLPASLKLRQALVSHLQDLVALTLGATRSAGKLARTRGLRATRLSAAKSYVVENSNRRDLSVNAVAAMVGVTARVLQRMFERDGTTFTEFLLRQRLNCALRMLAAAEPDRFIGQIGYEVGFNDLSYFHRAFKRRYGATPLEIRNHSPKFDGAD
ncbi:MAG TPA: AraC family transcriptional regulator [Pseudolabrys sp.]|nr:AraC family transcriptional regulator [Pseudolabrys sp.]